MTEWISVWSLIWCPQGRSRLYDQPQCYLYGVPLTVYIHLVCLVEWNLLLMPVVMEGKKRAAELPNLRKCQNYSLGPAQCITKRLLQQCLWICGAAYCTKCETEKEKGKERENDCERRWWMKPPIFQRFSFPQSVNSALGKCPSWQVISLCFFFFCSKLNIWKLRASCHASGSVKSYLNALLPC